jgi:hypothetical protein
VTVTTATIDAVADAGTPINGFTGGTAFHYVLANDTLNNAPVVADQVNTTLFLQLMLESHCLVPMY